MEYKNMYIRPGGIFITQEQYIVSTILGSCVSVCLWDGVNKIAAMNHFVLSYHAKNDDKVGKYGDLSLSYMLSEFKKLGAVGIVAHIIGGAFIPILGNLIVYQYVSLADEFLKNNRIPVLTRDVYGTFSRKIYFNTASGEVKIIKGK